MPDAIHPSPAGFDQMFSECCEWKLSASLLMGGMHSFVHLIRSPAFCSLAPCPPLVYVNDGQGSVLTLMLLPLPSGGPAVAKVLADQSCKAGATSCTPAEGGPGVCRSGECKVGRCWKAGCAFHGTSHWHPRRDRINAGVAAHSNTFASFLLSSQLKRAPAGCSDTRRFFAMPPTAQGLAEPAAPRQTPANPCRLPAPAAPLRGKLAGVRRERARCGWVGPGAFIVALRPMQCTAGQIHTRCIMTQTRQRSSYSPLLLLQVTCNSANCPGPCRVCNLATDSCELPSYTGTCTTAEQKMGRCVQGTCKVTAEHLVTH